MRRQASTGGLHRAIWRERRPFALLALLLTLLPTLLAPLSAAQASQAHGATICTAAGFAGGDADGSSAAHPGFACCGTLCAHGCATGLLPGHVPVAWREPLRRVTAAPPSSSSPERTCLADSAIRAPPATSA